MEFTHFERSGTREPKIQRNALDAAFGKVKGKLPVMK